MEQLGKRSATGLILSGGGARGLAHIGVLRVLEQTDVAVDVVAGTSMGAILGAFYAAGYRADEIYKLIRSLSWRDIIDFSLQGGFIKGSKLHAFLAEHLPRKFDDLNLPLAITTTDIETGEEVVITQGDLITALRASSSFPGAIEPIQFKGRTLADGGIINNLPVEAAAFLGASYTIASDTTAPRRAPYEDPNADGNWFERFVATVKLERRNPMAQMLLRSSDIMQSILTDMQYSLHPANVRVQHTMPHIRIESFWEFEAIVKEGEAAALKCFLDAGLLELSPTETADERVPLQAAS